MALFPPGKEREALTAFRRGEPIEDIHAALWPEGSTAVSYSTLRTLLRGLDAADVEEEPSDALPEDLDQAIRDLADARAKLAARITAQSDEECDPSLHAALAANVKAHIAASRHRIELQRHRGDMGERARFRRARG